MKQNRLLENVNMQLSADVQWQLLPHSGTTNQLYSGWYQYQSVVLRLNTEKQVLGVCRQREEKVLHLIDAKSWAPDVVQQQMPDKNQPGWLLMKRYAALGDAPIDDLHDQILNCIFECQQIKDLPLINYSALWNSYQQKIDELAKASQAQMLLDSIRVLMCELNDIAWIEACLVHHDLHKGNLLSSAGQLIVIDWEYAGLGTPWLDAAALVTEFSAPLQAVAALPAFRHIDVKTFDHAISIAQRINQQLNRLWYELGTDITAP
ncbi:phosphotransferase [Neptunomonas qingdaonensis]|uniref:Thiamine kinase n=1 Tax=Neptunomonas qingdaonensis TaxID=1045558 RepID=A0A1I2P445_9GAMM|nr:phosphotransferase [Neptunomonas qingdaonensis]SFG10982.1 thiamine kinase [Neptunomonas qingdaonensis]